MGKRRIGCVQVRQRRQRHAKLRRAWPHRRVWRDKSHRRSRACFRAHRCRPTVIEDVRRGPAHVLPRLMIRAIEGREAR